MFMVTGIIVGYQYGLLRSHILTKLGAMVALATVSRIASAFLLPDVGFVDVLFTLLAIILFAYVYYSLFREQIEEQRVREQAMRRQISRSEQYSQVGRNVGAILHNMKNVYFALNHGLEMLQHRSDDELKQVKVDRMELIASLRAATDSFSEKIDNIVEYTGNSRRTQKEQIYLRWHTARLIDIFSLDKEFKRHTTVQLDIPEDLWIEAPPIQLNQVLENLLMNSWEAIKAYRSEGRIRFAARGEEQHVVLRVEDDGGGIPGFEEAGLNGASLLHSDFFTIGRTTKPHGSGHGVAYIIETMRELGGDVVIYSSIGKGTATELHFPHPLFLEGEEESDSAAAPV
jgi:signal transduction histidine kinase